MITRELRIKIEAICEKINKEPDKLKRAVLRAKLDAVLEEYNNRKREMELIEIELLKIK